MNQYQGAIPEGALVRKFRDTGRTVVKKGGKEIQYKEYIKQKSKNNKSGFLKNKFDIGKAKMSTKSIIKPNKMEVHIKEHKPSEYKSIFFKQMEETDSLFS